MLVAAAAAWLCQRIGLPVVIGYITAGILIGPHTHLFALISDAGRIQSLAQIGLVFLIFSIGQGIKLQRLKKVGLPLVLATVIIAVMVLVGVVQGRVRISCPVSVTTTVCSNCAVHLRSLVSTVHPSSHMSCL